MTTSLPQHRSAALPISEILSEAHQHLAHALEDAAACFSHDHDLEGTRARFAAWTAALRRHMRWEETILSPAYERVTGRVGIGPTQVMREEHAEARELVELATAELARPGGGAFLELVEDIRTVLHSHEAKEERILGSRVDRLLSVEELRRLAHNLHQLLRAAD